MHKETIRIGNITTSKREIIDLAKSWSAIALAFSIMFYGGFSINSKFLSVFILSAITVGLGFLLHELAHKVVAQRYGCFAEFRSFDKMLVLAIAISFFGVVFAAPGAVFISGPVGRRRNGKISAAGPITNLVLALIFLATAIYFNDKIISRYGFMINSWLALFNMIPFGNFDGAMVFKWNKTVYIGIVAISVIFMIIQGVL